jgi:hypothetical protein
MLLVGVEVAFNVYPSTAASSGLLQVCALGTDCTNERDITVILFSFFFFSSSAGMPCYHSTRTVGIQRDVQSCSRTDKEDHVMVDFFRHYDVTQCTPDA